MTSLSPLAATVNVAIGGAAGAVLRYQAGRGMTRWFGAQTMVGYPWATIAVNVLGSIAMGLLAGYLARHSDGSGEQWRLLVGVGLLGGFTTFSAFSLELMLLIERGQPALALSYALVSVLAGLTGLYIGLIIMRIAA
ncbi:fluoride efflux transporter CrcB [Altererythrobacter confluentis]|uniref:Fluoride-specific ion channel FluC n=1 Tax=Allopontixanthobacter confluentis TaxID=1849021 RepID=A0A6L7GE71_9SPHN|nr:fluoride efflux transporter CrcB [Allopontixanthobacter confluentis]MXP13398.1 fluoride efflux transporter CrcB [Allopontixanthobacter confluentis]